jgi:uncharacterized UBP type Zn finger protein
MKQCSHLDQIRIKTTDKHVCEECIKMGDTWVHLRLCLECGNVGCFLQEQARHQALSSHQTSAHAFNRARRIVGLVLCGRV